MDISTIRSVTPQELPELCAKLRAYVLSTTATKAGHIASSLAVTELTVALHRLLDTPNDVLIWDVGHQAYVHKILCERGANFGQNRKFKGISGFPKRDESRFDAFGTGHSSTSISALAGMALGDINQGIQRKYVAVIGDGALTGGMAYEALNYIGSLGLNVTVVLNDNEMSIDPSVGALHMRQSYGEFFDALGWNYHHVINGNSVDELMAMLPEILSLKGPQLVHVKTQKTVIAEGPSGSKQFQDVFADELVAIAQQDAAVLAITPAMLSGSGLDQFQRAFPDRCFDVGIAEQHAVTMAAGMAASGAKPVVHLYSSFAQRAYDQIIHDVCLQNLPVVFCIDRAGLVGEDGATHHGAFDIAFLQTIPNLEILAPFDEPSLRASLRYALSKNGPVAIRYPKGAVPDSIISERDIEPIKLERGGKVVLCSFGKMTQIAMDLADLMSDSLAIDVIDMLSIKPLPNLDLSPYYIGITLEDGAVYNGAGVLLAQKHPNLKWTHFGLPDQFVEHGSNAELFSELKLDVQGILNQIKDGLES